MNRGIFDDIRLLKSNTVDYMRINQIPTNLLPVTFTGGPCHGNGIAIGCGVILDTTQSAQRGSVGTFGRGGWASTQFWIEPVEEMIGILMLQYIPSRSFPIREDFRDAVYDGLIG